MNTTASSALLTLFCAAILSMGCGAPEDSTAEASAAPDPAQEPIATEGFESGEPTINGDQNDDDGEDEAAGDEPTDEDASAGESSADGSGQ